MNVRTRWFMSFTVVLSLALTTVVVASAAQERKYDDPKPLPEERATDTYSVYEAALSNPIWGHKHRGAKYYIVDRAHKPNDWRTEQCMKPPDELRVKLKEMLDDLAAQADAYKVEPRFHLNEPYQLISTDPTQRRDSGGSELARGTEIIQLGIVSFSKDRSLASVVVWSSCGNKCGGSQWRVFKRGEKVWDEQPWSRCGAVF